MSFSLKKQTKRICIPFLSLPILMVASNLSIAAETLDQRIQKLESLVNELKHEAKQAKKEKVAVAATVKANPSSKKNSYSFGGFIKTTASYSDYSGGDLASGSAGRDFYIPGTIPVGGQSESQDFDFSAKETRINFKSQHNLDNGEVIKTYIEMDFLFPPGGNERVSNSYNPRVRHAFFTYGKWLFGQTWSTFQDVGALPESVDFLAASEGIIFERQPMVRYTNGGLQLALENPETTITPFGGGGRIVADDNNLPDFVARYNYKQDWGHITVSVLLRQLAYNVGTNDQTKSSTGVSVTGKFKVGQKDDLRFNFATGSGMGRYAGLNTANGAVLTATGELDAIDSTLGSIAYRHHWNSKWRSNLIYSRLDVDNKVDLTGTSVTKSVDSFQLNILYSPVPKVSFGVAYLDATRDLESGLSGDLQRFIFSAKYAF